MKKVIRITESELNNIVNRVLSEMPMGVPDNITETAAQLYSAILSKFTSSFDLRSTDHESFKVTIDGNFHVGDYNFTAANVELHLSEFMDPDSPPAIIGAAVGNKATVRGNMTYDEVNDYINIRIRFGVGTNWNLGMLLDLMKADQPNMISMLSHELFHQFEHHKYPGRPATEKSSYEAVQKLRIENVKPLNHFLHLLYYIHETERYTRPSELYGALKANKVTKEKFKEFFYDSDMIKTLTECKNYTFAKLLSELRDHMDEVDEFLSILKEKGAEVDLSAPDSVKINDLLKYFHIILNNLSIQEYIDMLRMGINPLAQLAAGMFGVPDEQTQQQQKYVDEFVKKVQSIKNYQDFFDYWIKRINFVGETTIKKLSKLYAMVDNEKDSIVNWDLHHKINRTADKTKMKLQELIKDPNTKISKRKK